MNKKINIVTLGCSKNVVDSEHLAGRCAGAGYDVVFDSNSTEAEIVVVNTCGFIGDAKEESVDTILGFADAKQRGDIDRLYVIGCLSERYADELRTEIPEVDSYFGARSLDGILNELVGERAAVGLRPEKGMAASEPSALADGNENMTTTPAFRATTPQEGNPDGNRCCGARAEEASLTLPSREEENGRSKVNDNPSSEWRSGEACEDLKPQHTDEYVRISNHSNNEASPPLSRRILSTPSHYAYLKISEGCDRRCGFCAIPLIRGNHVSVPVEELVREAEELAAQGVRELIVIAQDTTCYGLDLYGERRLAELLRRLARIEGIEWIRLHYAYPAGFPQDVIDTMRDEPKICKYLDIPLQHISDSQLKSMKRGLGSNGTRELIRKLRASIPGLAIRTTFLVGYPGETESDFEELLDFVREVRFERLGVFPYSEEEGTYSADKLTGDVPDEVKRQRVDSLMEVQAEISADINSRRVGTMETVIVDRREGDFWICRSRYDSPEVDTEILLTADDILHPGEFVDVRITGASEYDLSAERIKI